jgi:predicted permease
MFRFLNFLHELKRDLTYAVRGLLRSPVLIIVSALSLGFGIACATTLFSFLNAALIRPAPHVTDPHELVSIYSSESQFPYGPLSYLDFIDIREQTSALEDAVAIGHAGLTVSMESGTDRLLMGEQVSENYFEVLGVPMAHGRTFHSDDSALDWKVVILGHRFWQLEYGGDPSVLGRTIRVNGRDTTIVGIAPPGLLAADDPTVLDMWVPIDPSWRGSRGVQGLKVKGRLREGMGVEQVQVQLDVVAERLVEEYPQYWRDYNGEPRRLTVLSALESRLPPQHRAQVVGGTTMVFVLITLVLLVSCSNVANLMLARAWRRRGEIAVRLALGAGRRRLMMLLMTESGILAGLAGVLGLTVTYIMTDLLAKGRGPVPVPVALDISVDGRVAFFSIVLAMATAVAFGLVPALQASRTDVIAAVKGSDSGERARRFSFRNLLVVAQVTGSLVLVIGAALLLRSFQQARNADLGFDPQNVALLSLDLSHRDYEKEAGRQFYASLAEALGRLPQVESVSLARTVLLGPVSMNAGRVEPEGYEGDREERFDVSLNIVGLDYFDLVRIPLLRGRDFLPTDASDEPRVVVVNQAFAERFWPDEDPVGKRVRMDGLSEGFVEVVGIVRDAQYRSLTVGTQPRAWISFNQQYSHAVTVHVRTQGDPQPWLATFREEVRTLDGRLPIIEVKLLEDVVAEATAPQRYASMILGAGGFITLGLAMMGIYGVMAYTVGGRRREVGIRLALGAVPKTIAGMILREGLSLSGIGVALGLLLILMMTPLMRAVLYGVSPLDPLSLAGGILLLVLSSVAASLSPALRASRVDPAESLRYE